MTGSCIIIIRGVRWGLRLCIFAKGGLVMKKLIALMLALGMVVLGGVGALADADDTQEAPEAADTAAAATEEDSLAAEIDGLSDETLMALKLVVDREFSERFVNDSARIYDGIYTVGEDIAPGEYVLVAESHAGGEYDIVRILVGWAEKDETVIDTSIDDGGNMRVTLEAGMVFAIKNTGVAYLRTVGSPDWAVKD